MKDIVIAKEDFSDFKIGEFPYDRDHSAMGEYQYVSPEGYCGNWSDQVCNYTWNGTGPTWIITSIDGKHYIESMRIEKGRPHIIYPTLETGSRFWCEYRAEITVRRLSQRGMTGLAFCLNHSIDTLVFYLEGKTKCALAYRHKEELNVLASAEYIHNSDESYRLAVDCNGNAVTCYINDVPVITAESEIVKRGGKIAITADCPSRFSDVTVSVDNNGLALIQQHERQHKAIERAELQRHPQMKLWKEIDLRDFGTSRQIRFGHLTGGDEWHIVLAQMQKHVDRDAYGFISCLTAIDLNGNVLWQRGEPSQDACKIGKVSADVPLQVYDINGDGIDEVIVGLDFEIHILNGSTGETIKSVKTPTACEDDDNLIGVPYNQYAFTRLNPDGIRICNLRGLERPADILIKDRYCRVWALDDELNVMWKYISPTNTGHCPLPVDIDGDGRDELLIGYRLLDSDGTELWHYPIKDDHTDEIVAGRWKPNDAEGYFACVSGTQGFFIGDFYGNIIKLDYIGHAQRVSVANYCPGRPGLEIAVTNYWGHQGCIFIYDYDGNQITELHNDMNGNIIAPVNWDGDGTELILTNPDPINGGLITGYGIKAVEFPDDGHPVMCCEAISLTGDERDEIVVWDYHKMCIYTQSDSPKPQAYHPIKFPIYNASNYRGEYAYPDASYLDFHADKQAMRNSKPDMEV